MNSSNVHTFSHGSDLESVDWVWRVFSNSHVSWSTWKQLRELEVFDTRAHSPNRVRTGTWRWLTVLTWIRLTLVVSLLCRLQKTSAFSVGYGGRRGGEGGFERVVDVAWRLHTTNTVKTSTFESLQLRWPIHIINPVDKTKLSCYSPHRRSPTVSLETYPPTIPIIAYNY